MTETAEALLERQRNLDESKADLLIDYLKLGMDWDTACTACELKKENQEKLLDDPDFQARLKYHLAKKEAELLERLREASYKAAEQGNSKGVERMLEVLRPDRYGKHATLDISAKKTDTDNGIRISFVGAKKKEEALPTSFGDELDDDTGTTE